MGPPAEVVAVLLCGAERGFFDGRGSCWRGAADHVIRVLEAEGHEVHTLLCLTPSDGGEAARVVRAFNLHHPVVRCRRPPVEGPTEPGDAEHDAR